MVYININVTSIIVRRNNNNNNSLFTFPFLHNITMFSIFRKREEKLDSY